MAYTITHLCLDTGTPDQVARYKLEWGLDEGLTSARMVREYKHARSMRSPTEG